MKKVHELTKWYEKRPTWQKVALGAGAVAGVAATAGLAGYAIAQGGVIVAVGETVVVAGPAALALARGR
jgi:hypothetical protein